MSTKYCLPFLGIASEDWSGNFRASLLLLNPIAGLCAAVKRKSRGRLLL